MSFVFANFIKTTLAANVTSTATSIKLSSSANLPVLSAGQILPITLNDAATGAVYEIVYCTAISGAVLTVTRGQENTTAVAWLSGDTVFGSFTAETVFPEGGNTNPQEVGDATTATEALPLGQAQANFAALAGLSTQVFNAAAATTATEVVPLGQVYQQLSIAASQSLTLSALETVVFSNGLTSNITITLEPGTIQGQKVRFMSGNPTTYGVTVNSNVSSGSPAFYLPDGTSMYSSGPTNSTPQGSLSCQWDGTNWHCQTTGLDSVMVCCEQQPSGTNGGSSVAGLQTRILNTVLWNTISGASLSSNEITLPAGTYDIRADLPASTTTGIDHRGYLYIPSTSTISLLGSSASTGGSVTVSEIEGMLNTAGVTFNIQHWISVAQATTGLGIASGMGQPEVYTQIFIRKVE